MLRSVCMSGNEYMYVIYVRVYAMLCDVCTLCMYVCCVCVYVVHEPYVC